MTKTIQQTVQFPGVSPDQLFAIYLDETKHAQAVQGAVAIRNKVGAAFSVFGDNGLRGTNLQLVPDRMIVQSWRANVWRDEDLDSTLTLTFNKTKDGACVELVQANVPDHAYDVIVQGWERHYWQRWREYLYDEVGSTP